VPRILGVEIPPDDQRRLLEGLAIRFVETTSAASEPAATFSVPSFRVDLKREIDLVEELARLYGVDRIPSSPPRGAIGENSYDATHDLLAEIRRLLIGLGLHEAQGQTLIGASAADLVRPTAPGQDLARLSHPLSSDMNTLRPSLLPGLIDSLRHNVSRKNLDVALFEVGRVFATAAGRFTEGRRVALAMTGQRAAPFWSGAERDARCDVFDLKGLVEECLESFGVRGFTFVKQAAPGSLFLASALVQLGRQSLGELGQLQPQIARQHDLRDPVYLAELDLDLLIARRNPGRAFRPLPVQPAIRRDVALVVAEETTHDAVVAAVRASRPAHLEGLELFDVFRGEKLPPGQKSMAYAFLYRHAERTLTDAEVNAAHEKLVAELTQKLAASIRS
jgi:phenylalanyl-tRNA synthetase beta chain